MFINLLKQGLILNIPYDPPVTVKYTATAIRDVPSVSMNSHHRFRRILPVRPMMALPREYDLVPPIRQVRAESTIDQSAHSS